MRSTLGLYQPGTSLLHRLPPGVKLLALLAVGMVSVVAQRWWFVVLALVAATVVVYLAAGFSVGLWWRQIRPMWLILALTAAMHVWASGWERAVAITGMIVVLVSLAALVTLTSPTASLVDAVVRASGWLRRFGVDPERVGIFLLVGIRCVPLVAGLAAQVREAQIARRATTSVGAFLVPLIVRALREADALGEALVARGVDD
ncbi:energy-coupling factor transporter transmembrane protein EcfT [Propioniciclava sp.]|uniref:energy-coupling factor transporter transmembrane component T family protein n=1 Tax=Propioniciclava sp. TaxID=2038686 RepID=UPI0026306F57|nr:energy-coupling factor transporter transmembrane protein EcfT [Propioniciclava sp.]